MSSVNGNPAEPAPGACPAGIVVSPLLNLAPCSPSAPRLNQHRPIIALGGEGLGGTVLLSLAPDRRIVEVKAQVSRPATMRLLRIEAPEAHRLDREQREDLLLLAFYAARPGFGGLEVKASFPLQDRGRFEPFAPLSALDEIAICWSGLRGSSIEGVSVEPARAPSAPGSDEGDYFKRRMLAEIGAAERSLSAVAASRHVELANLYARHLGDGHHRSAQGRRA